MLFSGVDPPVLALVCLPSSLTLSHSLCLSLVARNYSGKQHSMVGFITPHLESGIVLGPVGLTFRMLP